MAMLLYMGGFCEAFGCYEMTNVENGEIAVGWVVSTHPGRCGGSDGGFREPTLRAWPFPQITVRSESPPYALRTQVLDVWRPVQFTFNLPLSRFVLLVLAFSVLLVGVYAISGLYAMRVRLSILHEISRVFIATSAGVLGVILFIFLRQELFNSRFLIIGFWFLAFIFVSSG